MATATSPPNTVAGATPAAVPTTTTAAGTGTVTHTATAGVRWRRWVRPSAAGATPSRASENSTRTSVFSAARAHAPKEATMPTSMRTEAQLRSPTVAGTPEVGLVARPAPPGVASWTSVATR